MRKILLVICSLALLFSGCGSVDRSDVTSTMPATTKYKKITAKEAKTMMETGNVIVVDVRTREEYDEGHIENAVLLPDAEIEEKAEKTLSDKNAVILVYCRSGRRSEIAAKELIQMGYTNVYDFGGIIDWPHEIVT